MDGVDEIQKLNEALKRQKELADKYFQNWQTEISRSQFWQSKAHDLELALEEKAQEENIYAQLD